MAQMCLLVGKKRKVNERERSDGETVVMQKGKLREGEGEGEKKKARGEVTLSVTLYFNNGFGRLVVLIFPMPSCILLMYIV